MSEASEPESVEPTEATAEWAHSESEEMEIEFGPAPTPDDAPEPSAEEPATPPEPSPPRPPASKAEPDPGSSTIPPLLSAIASLDQSLQRRLDALQSTFEREVRAEATREKVVDRLHAELQEYKNDLLLNVLRPVFVDLIQLHDDIGKIVGADGREQEPDAARLLDLMKGFQQGIEDILYRQGVEPFQKLEDDAFDPRRQRAYATVPNDDPGLSKRVAARLRKGFQSGDRVIRPEIVSVYASPKPSNGG